VIHITGTLSIILIYHSIFQDDRNKVVQITLCKRKM